MKKNDLMEYRKMIDKIDAEIGRLIKERVKIIKKVGKLKADLNVPVEDNERINEVYKNFAENSGLDFEDAKKIYSPLIRYCISIEKEIKNKSKEKNNG